MNVVIVSEDMEYPMWLVPVSTLLQFEKLPSHQEALSRGMLVSDTTLLFVSDFPHRLLCTLGPVHTGGLRPCHIRSVRGVVMHMFTTHRRLRSLPRVAEPHACRPGREAAEGIAKAPNKDDERR